jgi:hypothetical protein
MPRKMPDAQAKESRRTERVTLAVTPLEREAIEMVADVHGRKGATIFRDMSLPEIMKERARLLRLIAPKVTGRSRAA